MDEQIHSSIEPEEPIDSTETLEGKKEYATRSGLRSGLRVDPTLHLMQLIIKETGQPPITYDLEADTIRLGRAEDNDIRVEMPYVSRHQAILTHTATGYNLRPAPEASSSLIHHGHVVPAQGLDLQADDFFRVIGDNPGEMVTFIFIRAEAPATITEHSLSLAELITIGRDADNTLGSGNPSLKPHQARIERLDQRIRLIDTGGGNITRVNGQPISGEVWLNTGDAVRIGTLRLTIHDTSIQYSDHAGEFLMGMRRIRAVPDDLWDAVAGAGGVALEALHLNKHVRADVNLLQDISLRFRPRELVILVGLSGAGKSTLMDALAGYRPATEGQVLFNGVDLYKHFQTLRTNIGFVPQKDIIHMQLTTFEALDYAAQLRMPPDTTPAQRHQRVEEVMAELGLTEQRDVRVSALSGGQQKRVSIGVELITRPDLFFLDEPSSGLDPGTETGLMQLLRNLADQDRTIILITHATKNMMLADKVIFMVRGGRVAWFGPPDEALAYFDQFRPEQERLDKPMEFDRIYSILEDPALGSPVEWAERYKATLAYKKYIALPLKLIPGRSSGAGKKSLPKEVFTALEDEPSGKTSQVGKAAAEKQPPTPPKQVSAFRQFLILTARNLKLLTRDPFSLVLMLIAPPILAMLDFVISSRYMYDSTAGDVLKITITLNTLVIDAMLVGALAQMREIIKDTDIYKRERLVNLKLTPYVLSKVGVAAILALYQALPWVLIRYLAVNMPVGFNTVIGIYITMVLSILAGMLLGLLASALTPTADSVALLVAMLIVPQVLFSGALLPIPTLNPVGQALTAIMPSRWAFELLTTQGGHGKTLAADACWKLPKDQRDALTDAQKSQCTCMGANIFKKCDFPGIRSYYDPAVDQPEPVKPAEPVLPDPPTGISVLTALPKYQSDLTKLLTDYRAQLQTYQTDYTHWKEAHSKAIASAEARLEVEYNNFGPIYNIDIVSHWLMLLLITGVLTVIILAIQKVKDVL